MQAKELAEILCISEAALSSQRRRGTGIPAVMLQGCRPRYDRDEIIAWLKGQLPRPRDAGPTVTPAPSPDRAR